jgi:hypothetical protein
MIKKKTINLSGTEPNILINILMSHFESGVSHIYIGHLLHSVLIQSPLMYIPFPHDTYNFGGYVGILSGINIFCVHDISCTDVYYSTLEPEEFYNTEFKVKQRKDKLKNINKWKN